MLSELSVWEAHPSGGSLKSGALDVESKPFTPQGEDGSLEFPPDCMAFLLRVEFMEKVRLNLSYLF